MGRGHGGASTAAETWPGGDELPDEGANDGVARLRERRDFEEVHNGLHGLEHRDTMPEPPPATDERLAHHGEPRTGIGPAAPARGSGCMSAHAAPSAPWALDEGGRQCDAVRPQLHRMPPAGTPPPQRHSARASVPASWAQHDSSGVGGAMASWGAWQKWQDHGRDAEARPLPSQQAYLPPAPPPDRGPSWAASCRACGNPLTDDSNFCRKCGWPVQVERG